jgi:hypothetical protein
VCDAGLFISSAIAELHGGVLLARSEGLGRGSTLSLLLPLFVEPDPDPDPTANHRDLEAGVSA